LKEKLPYLVLGLVRAITSYWAVASNNHLTSLETYGRPARIAMTGYSLWFYLEKTVLPVALSPLYELPAVVNPLEPRFLLSGAAVLVISAALLALHRRWPAGLAVWVYYGIVLGPVSGIVHAGHQLTHDRYSYLSCLGWAPSRGSGREYRASRRDGRGAALACARCGRGGGGLDPRPRDADVVSDPEMAGHGDPVALRGGSRSRMLDLSE
jgi:hypothetical protein